MTTKNYKNKLVTAYREHGLSLADFSNTVDHFEKLVRGEYKEEATELIEGGKYVYTGERIQSLNAEDVFLKTNSIVVYARVLNGFSSVKDKEGLKWIIKNSDLAPLPNPTDMKSKLNDGFTVVYRDGKEREFKGEEIYVGYCVMSRLDNFNENLKHIIDSKFDIVSIRDTNNVEIWKRNDKDEWVEVDEMEKLNEALEQFKHGFNADAAKPLIDLLPREQHNSNRIIEIGQAIIRYTEAGKQVPSEWVSELNELTC
jgi:hypothetical protein